MTGSRSERFDELAEDVEAGRIAGPDLEDALMGLIGAVALHHPVWSIVEGGDPTEIGAAIRALGEEGVR